jgi:hypothetical protein
MVREGGGEAQGEYGARGAYSRALGVSEASIKHDSLESTEAALYLLVPTVRNGGEG